MKDRKFLGGLLKLALADGGDKLTLPRLLREIEACQKAHGVALVYAELKWGKNITKEQGKILFHRAPEVQREWEKSLGWSR